MDWSPAIANEFIRRAKAEGRHLTQMQLQKLVYISHGWNLAINGKSLTIDDPEAWEYGPVYRELRTAVKHYGSSGVTQEIDDSDYFAGEFRDDGDETAVAELNSAEVAVIERVFRDYGRFHAFRLSALTHQAGTPWTQVYDNGAGRGEKIPADLIQKHFLELGSRKTT